MNKTVSILKILVGFFVLTVFLNPAFASEKPQRPAKPKNIIYEKYISEANFLLY